MQGLDKTLLSEVLRKWIKYFDIDGNIIKIRLDGTHISQQTYEEINIYELAWKCKEWCYKKEFLISSTFSEFGLDVEGMAISSSAMILKPNNDGTSQMLQICSGKTEPEAIFLAWQWCYKQVKEK